MATSCIFWWPFSRLISTHVTAVTRPHTVDFVDRRFCRQCVQGLTDHNWKVGYVGNLYFEVKIYRLWKVTFIHNSISERNKRLHDLYFAAFASVARKTAIARNENSIEVEVGVRRAQDGSTTDNHDDIRKTGLIEKAEVDRSMSLAKSPLVKHSHSVCQHEVIC